MKDIKKNYKESYRLVFIAKYLIKSILFLLLKVNRNIIKT